MVRLVSCGYHFTHKYGCIIHRPGGAGNYAFVLHKTKSEALLNGEMQIVPANSYIFYRPDTPQFYKHLEKPYIDDWFHCEGEELELFLDEICFPMDQIVPAVDPAVVSRYIMDLRESYRQIGSLRDKILDCDLRALLMKLRQMDKPLGLAGKNISYFRHMSLLRDKLYSFPQARFSVEYLASQMNLSKSYFQHLYKELFGVSVTRDMITARVEYAKYLLESKTFSVAEVAELCGYENDVHFIRQFKEMVGFTPGKYKTDYRVIDLLYVDTAQRGQTKE